MVVGIPGVASADVIFDQADADELAATLTEAYEAQNVCYGWLITVDNEGVPQESVGSNFGAGTRITQGDCAKSVELQASVSWTPESSESEDSASYTVVSTPGGPTTEDLEDLDLLSEDDLTGDDVDAAVYKAVAALPLLAADAGVASPIEASPAPESEASGAAPTNSPGSDFWRESGMMLLWGALLLLAGAVFAWYAIKTSRRPARRRTIGPVQEQIPDTVPPEWTPAEEAAVDPVAFAAPDPAAEQKSTPSPAAEPPVASPPAARKPEAAPEPPSARPKSTASPAAEPEPAAEPPSAEPAEPAKPDDGNTAEAPPEPPAQPAEPPPGKPDPETRPES